MQPIRPEIRKQILAADPTAERDIQEYERLLAARFTRDPDFPAAGEPAATETDNEDRNQLSALRDRLLSLLPPEHHGAI
jgi:hypothetical protein